MKHFSQQSFKHAVFFLLSVTVKQTKRAQHMNRTEALIRQPYYIVQYSIACCLLDCFDGAFDRARTVRMAEAGGDGALRVGDGRQVLEARFVMAADVLALAGDPGEEVRQGGSAVVVVVVAAPGA